MRAVVTDGIVVRAYASSLSSKATTRYKAHTVSCRYASTGEPMADLVGRFGNDRIRTKVLVGSVEPCTVCKPALLVEGDA